MGQQVVTKHRITFLFLFCICTHQNGFRYFLQYFAWILDCLNLETGVRFTHWFVIDNPVKCEWKTEIKNIQHCNKQTNILIIHWKFSGESKLLRILWIWRGEWKHNCPSFFMYWLCSGKTFIYDGIVFPMSNHDDTFLHCCHHSLFHCHSSGETFLILINMHRKSFGNIA